MRLLSATLVVLGLSHFAGSARAVEQGVWQGFYRPSVASVTHTTAGDNNICVQRILEAQERYQIPDNLLLAIGIQEAGRKVGGALTIWPWTANANGEGRFFDSKSALEDWVQQTRGRGIRSIDVGCMQVNQLWHGNSFASLTQATDPASNIDYAARFLRQLYAETQDWWEAAGRYHSATPALKATYLQKLAQNRQIANSGVLNKAPVQTAAERASQPGINWTSDMTAGTQGMLSIYSGRPLRPILPAYHRAP